MDIERTDDTPNESLETTGNKRKEKKNKKTLSKFTLKVPDVLPTINSKNLSKTTQHLLSVFGEIPLVMEYDKKRTSYKASPNNNHIKALFDEVSARLEVQARLKYDYLKREKRTIENNKMKESFSVTIQDPIYLELIKKIKVIKALISTLF